MNVTQYVLKVVRFYKHTLIEDGWLDAISLSIENEAQRG